MQADRNKSRCSCVPRALQCEEVSRAVPSCAATPTTEAPRVLRSFDVCAGGRRRGRCVGRLFMMSDLGVFGYLNRRAASPTAVSREAAAARFVVRRSQRSADQQRGFALCGR